MTCCGRTACFGPGGIAYRCRRRRGQRPLWWLRIQRGPPASCMCMKALCRASTLPTTAACPNAGGRWPVIRPHALPLPPMHPLAATAAMEMARIALLVVVVVVVVVVVTERGIVSSISRQLRQVQGCKGQRRGRGWPAVSCCSCTEGHLWGLARSCASITATPSPTRSCCCCTALCTTRTLQHLPAVGAVGTPGPAAGGAQRGHHYRGAALPTFRCWLAH
mmetsp:Transcript_23633/g.65069  ORF Transcript_23633/g.65069 Transcript_23633/m.65069 type:complete len:220 (-) Transcript_23633:886-1545(-)